MSLYVNIENRGVKVGGVEVLTAARALQNITSGAFSSTVTAAKFAAAANLAESLAAFGGLEIQGVGPGNNWAADNLYYNGGFRVRNSGYAVQIYFEGGDIGFYTVPNTVAGTLVTPTRRGKLSNGGVWLFGSGSAAGEATAGGGRFAGRTQFDEHAILTRGKSVSRTTADAFVMPILAADDYTLSSAADTEGPGGQGLVAILRDASYGGSAFVFYDIAGGVTIVAQGGATAFVTGAPAATQIQIKPKAVGQGLNFLAGSSRNGVMLRVTTLLGHGNAI